MTLPARAKPEIDSDSEDDGIVVHDWAATTFGLDETGGLPVALWDYSREWPTHLDPSLYVDLRKDSDEETPRPK